MKVKLNRLGVMARMMMIVALCIAMVFIVAPSANADEKASSPKANRYNVVFVSDASGSMNDTDPDGLRYDAISRFVALLADDGNRIGDVVFSTDIKQERKLAEPGSVADKKAFTDSVAKVKAEGWTNIGLGLDKAVAMLKQGGNHQNPSLIILLTDGNTAMGSDKETEESQRRKARAIEQARNDGDQIYTVCLNADGTADTSEMKQIADATGGQFREVTKASDLRSVFDLYYSMVFPTQSDTEKDLTIPSSGMVEGSFEIAGVGVEEANVLITGKPTDYELIDPDGTRYDRKALQSSTFTSGEFVSIKQANPKRGTWTYRIGGVPGEHVRINIVRNTDLSAQLSMPEQPDAAEPTLKAGASAEVLVQVEESGTVVDAGQLDRFNVTLFITDANGAKTEDAMQLEDDGFVADVDFPDRGTYTLNAHVEGEGYELDTNTLTVNIDNSAPIRQHDIDQTVKLWPFKDNTVSINLSGAAKDKQDAELRYEVASTAFQGGDYQLDGDRLIIKHFSLPEGSFTIRAIDKDGASCTFNVHIDTINIGLLTLIGIGAAALVVLIVIAITLYIALNKRFMGAVYVRELGVFDHEVKKEKGRGRLRLYLFGIPTHGIDARKAYFQASGKDYVTFVSKKKVYAEGRMEKKVRIPGNGIPVTIKKDGKSADGIEVRFESRKLKFQF